MTAKDLGPILDQVFRDHSPPEPPDEVRRLMERGDDAFVEALHTIGLYVEARLVAEPTESAAAPTAYLMLAGRVGNMAFSDRVLRPTVVQDREILADIEDATAAADYERTRRRLLGLDDD